MRAQQPMRIRRSGAGPSQVPAPGVSCPALRGCAAPPRRRPASSPPAAGAPGFVGNDGLGRQNMFAIDGVLRAGTGDLSEIPAAIRSVYSPVAAFSRAGPCDAVGDHATLRRPRVLSDLLSGVASTSAQCSRRSPSSPRASAWAVAAAAWTRRRRRPALFRSRERYERRPRCVALLSRPRYALDLRRRRRQRAWRGAPAALAVVVGVGVSRSPGGIWRTWASSMSLSPAPRRWWSAPSTILRARLSSSRSFSSEADGLEITWPFAGWLCPPQ